MGGDVTLTCPIQTPNEIKNVEWSWYRFSNSTKQKVTAIKENDSNITPNMTSSNQPVIRATSHDSTLTFRGLQMNDTGVYGCEIDAGNHTELRYIKLIVNGRFPMRMKNL